MRLKGFASTRRMLQPLQPETGRPEEGGALVAPGVSGRALRVEEGAGAQDSGVFH